MHIEEAVQIVRTEYSETPTLALTPWQAQHLWNFSEELCERALRSLVSSSFLVRTPEGFYVRRDHATAEVAGVGVGLSERP
jgi:hypothetical protein